MNSQQDFNQATGGTGGHTSMPPTTQPPPRALTTFQAWNNGGVTTVDQGGSVNVNYFFAQPGSYTVRTNMHYGIGQSLPNWGRATPGSSQQENIGTQVLATSNSKINGDLFRSWPGMSPPRP